MAENYTIFVQYSALRLNTNLSDDSLGATGLRYINLRYKGSPLYSGDCIISAVSLLPSPLNELLLETQG